ncbi:MAG: hypothetical protein AB1540_06800 [Bdellovibrionota bacterium]
MKKQYEPVKLLRSFLEDESGQASIEYVSLLAVIAGLFLVVGPLIRNAMRNLLEGTVGNYLERRFFQSGAIHRFPIRIPQ